uniref:histidine kinase n=1 Tax=Cyanothece sp. (strain PCC 7425 / ATCC 29141) TaxID=395961 RepID=B8HZ56_CYAP4
MLNWFTANPFIPHGHCYLWQPALVSLHLLSDALIALAYYSIPLTLLYFIRKRQDIPFPQIFSLFIAFIIACGTTHLMEIWTLWHPTYWLSGVLKAGTAFVSVLTAFELVPIIPKALALPSPTQLEQSNAFLQSQIEERLRVEDELRHFQNELEQRVQARTAELVTVNQQLQREIEERRQTMVTLRESEERLRFALLASRMGMWDWNLQGQQVQWSDNLETLFGLGPGEFDGSYAMFINRLHPEDKEPVQAAINHSIATGQNYDIEFRTLLPDGKIRWLLSQGKVFYDPNGQPARMAGINIDITERKSIENNLRQLTLELEERVQERTAALEASLQEKVLLLREIHHRVKNNLQIVSSLLMLQSDTITDPYVTKVLQESQERIQSIALVHEHLYSSPNLSQIDFSSYIEKLVKSLFTTWGNPNLKLHFDLESTVINLETAFPCGLLINELVSNALIHAFPNQIKGNIWVVFRAAAAGFILVVKDDGIGLPEQLDYRNTESLGMQLICDLSQQLNGTLSLMPLQEDDNCGRRGTCFKLDFQELIYRKRL